jgi:hypothetical protein
VTNPIGNGLFRLFAATPQGSRLLKRLGNAENVAEACREKNIELERQIESVRAELARAESEKSSLGEQLASAQRDRTAIFAELAAARAEHETLSAIHRETHAEFDATRMLHDERTSELAHLRGDHAHLTSIHSIGDGKFPFVPNGHFYSPIPSLDDVKRDWSRIFRPDVGRPIGIDLRESEQLALLRTFAGLQADLPFEDKPTNGLRFGFENPAYSYSDALFLNATLRHFKPSRLIEVGSGHSSCMTLDTNDIWLDGKMQCTFIEPYPELLTSLLKPEDLERITVLPTRVQDVGLDVFRELDAGDVLFIDSTHVSKVGSDVNYLFLEVLPSLNADVLIHVHDVFYPFEYPCDWILDGRAWNELYLLRALLQQSAAYEIVLMNSFLAHEHRGELGNNMPLALKNPGGSIWLRKKSPAWPKDHSAV